eukprot:3589369-Rhodomonas_salina.2
MASQRFRYRLSQSLETDTRTAPGGEKSQRSQHDRRRKEGETGETHSPTRSAARQLRKIAAVSYTHLRAHETEADL